MHCETAEDPNQILGRLANIKQFDKTKIHGTECLCQLEGPWQGMADSTAVAETIGDNSSRNMSTWIN